MKLALAQINPTVGDLEGNARKIIDHINRAKVGAADLIIFPELALTGYPPEDLLLKPQFIDDNLSWLKGVAAAAKGIAVCLGFVDKRGRKLYNAAAFLADGKIKTIYHKANLPNYSVFDEKRYFAEGDKPAIVNYRGTKIGLLICEDLWVDPGPYLTEARQGARLILNINASPYHCGKVREREKLVRARAKRTGAYVVYVNMVGGQDELVFDGGSMVASPRGKLIAAAGQYREELLFVDLKDGGKVSPWLDDEEEVYNALLLGVKDYVNKNGFSEVVIGLSGGIDSALTLAIAADALGPERVHAIFMPSDYTSRQSCTDAKEAAFRLGAKMETLPIKEPFKRTLSELRPLFKGRPENIAEENLQARIRGNYLMALSNKFGWLVLTTGNKSEMSAGYCTLYGDMAGGYAVLKDVPKTLVYRLVDWRNAQREVIPGSIIDRPPTAELKPNQKDQDTLPEYELLDRIIKEYVEENKSVAEIVKLGCPRETVARVAGMIDRAEYKRRQAPPGPRITSRAFGKDWRLPITNKYKEKVK
ncbi:MAG: NAD+ synthase [Candidatus Margulisbacteria bacterium]|nr:NAD+ synthase [Candidatus Margulisiibacteriota bacterium]MBU1616675.1 NAD+ synthase [Candidatus Margulisiibacteriota bacterium]MBU1867461.1 NAD+ synthase [Candidatus Margulisiibacteriota bacterium]